MKMFLFRGRFLQVSCWKKLVQTMVSVLVFDIRLRRMEKSESRKQRSMNTLRTVIGKNDWFG